MKISLPINQFFDDTGFPLVAGRVSIFTHDSDTICKVFTLSGDIYSEAVNPIITTEDGRIPTLFFDAAVVDVKVEKANGDGSYELLDTFQAGFNVPDATNDTVVNGLDALKGTNPEVGVVSVYGYDKNAVAPMRHYVWDPTCTDAADDGVVVLSNTTDTGRWILLWDDEKLPCTVYGIVPGHEANISAFLGYPDFIGQWSIRTPRIPRFLSGTYTSNTTFTTARSLYFDDGAKFVNANFVCYSAMVPANSGFVANFSFTGKNVSAHSSWFREAGKFFSCGALDLFIDSENFFTGTTVSSVVTVKGANVYGNGRIALEYNGGHLHFEGCNFQAKGILSPSLDVVKFTKHRWNQSIFIGTNPERYDFGSVADGHRIEFGFASGNEIDLQDFPVSEIYVKAREAYERSKPSASIDYSLDMEGRMLGELRTNFFNFVKDTRISGYLYISGDNGSYKSSVTLENVRCDGVTTIKASNLKATGCSLVFNGEDIPKGMQSAVFTGCEISTDAGKKWTADTAITATGCRWKMPIAVNEDNETACSMVKFIDCDVDSCAFAHKNLNFKDCTITGCSVLVLPFKEGNSYKLKFEMVGCAYDSAKAVRFDHVDLKDGQTVILEGVNPEVKICNNTFPNAEGIGIWVRFWSDVVSGKVFLKRYSDGEFVYSGNSGYCPEDSFRGIFTNFTEKNLFFAGGVRKGFHSSEIVRVLPRKQKIYSNLSYGEDGQHTTMSGRIDGDKGSTPYVLTGNLSSGIYSQNARDVDLSGGDLHGDWNDMAAMNMYLPEDESYPADWRYAW